MSVGPTAPARAALLALAWMAGLALQLRQAALWTPHAVGAQCAAALALAALAWPLRRRWAGTLALALAAALLAHGSTAWRAQQRLDERLASALEGRDLVVIGVVDGLPRSGPQGQRFAFATEAATLDGAAVRLPPRLSLGWYAVAGDDPTLAGAGPELRAGQRWRLGLRLHQPHGLANPGGWDLELSLFEQGIGAVGSVRAHPEPELLAPVAGRPLQRLRQDLRDAIFERLGDPMAAGVVAALAIGDQASIDRAGWDLFRDTGVSHLVAISGLHVTMLAWLAAALIDRLWRLSPRLLRACPAPRAALWGGFVVALAYALLAGWGVPAQRTVWMIAAVVALRSAGLRWPLHAVLLAAALAVLLADPWALLQPGFWLSYMAVAMLIAAEPVRRRREPAPVDWRGRGARWLLALLRTQAVATISLAPLTLLFFQQVSLVGLLANLVAIPLVTLAITPLALLGIVLPVLWSVDGWLVQALMAVLSELAAAPVWTAAAAPPWAVACGLLGGIVAVLPLPWRQRGLALPLLLPLLAPAPPRPAPGQFELVAADIGQGTAVLVRTHGHLLVYDSGPRFGPEADAGERVLLPLLRRRGESRIDMLMLSHRDADHIGGAASLLAALRVEQVLTSIDADSGLLPALPHYRRCRAGQSWDWDGVQFEVLHPAEEVAAKPNALSCVLRVAAPGRSALLTGDIEAAQEAALLERAGAALRADMLLVPHHGSKTSSTDSFIAAVRPRWAVVQAAYRSRYGHPAPPVLARYERQRIEIVRSDRCGAWTWPADGGAPWCQRDVARRYWHHHPEGDPPSAQRGPPLASVGSCRAVEARSPSKCPSMSP
ncbi:MAG: DNA internalization-related competence protein ComEC/Rec2 [Burkholderiales bacterium]|nr:DNA internalization-related competence protein ComEC/Rec2 [Burkholderiales bacterium]